MVVPRGLLVRDGPASRGRWLVSLAIGFALGMLAFFGSNLLPQALLGRTPVGIDYALVGLVQALLVPAAVVLALRPVGLRLGDVGVTGSRFAADALVGLAVATTFAALQFGLIIPATGGAARSDIVANAAQIGDSPLGLLGFIVLAWTGAIAEELYFRGHFLVTLRNALGRTPAALFGAAAVTIVLFALLHGYQGWAGVVDAGLFGGLSLTALFLWRGGRLTSCAVAHAAWNSLAATGIYLLY